MAEPAPHDDGQTDGAAAPAPDNRPVVEVVQLLVGDLRTAAQNEMALLKVGGTVMAQAVRQFSIWATAALLFAFVGLLALIFGGILALANVVGALLATVIVAGTMLAAAAFAALRSRAATRRIKHAVEQLLP